MLHFTFIAFSVTHIDVYREGYSKWKVDAVVEVSTNHYCILNFMLQSEHICQNSRVSYKFCEKANNRVCSSTNNITQTELSNNEEILTAFVFVPENQHYDTTVINQIGKYSLSSSGIDMSKYNI